MTIQLYNSNILNHLPPSKILFFEFILELSFAVGLGQGGLGFFIHLTVGIWTVDSGPSPEQITTFIGRFVEILFIDRWWSNVWNWWITTLTFLGVVNFSGCCPFSGQGVRTSPWIRTFGHKWLRTLIRVSTRPGKISKFKRAANIFLLNLDGFNFRWLNVMLSR